MKKIIFVCTGNTCRSPMAEKIGEKIASEKNLELEVQSRGVSVYMEEPAHKNAKNAIKKYGLSLDNHYAKQMNDRDIEDETIILTMTAQHKTYLLTHFPIKEGKVHVIRELIGEQGDIVDPYGKSQEEYDGCADQLYRTINKIFDNL